MTDSQRFSRLLAEFRRVGVDPETFSAVISVTPEAALRALSVLDDDAGPAAFLARLRQERDDRPEVTVAPATPPPA